VLNDVLLQPVTKCTWYSNSTAYSSVDISNHSSWCNEWWGFSRILNALCILKIILTYDTVFLFYDHKVCPKKLGVILGGFVIHVFLLLNINCILVTRIPDDGHGGVRNLLLMNSMRLCIFVNVHLLDWNYVNNIGGCHSSVEEDWILLRIWGPCWLVHSDCHSGGAVFIQPSKNPEHGGSNFSSQNGIISKMTLIFINTRFYTKKRKT
jgi:hypothetical protein